MVAESDVSRIKKELADDNRDVADLWTDALRKYKGIVGEDLVPKFANVDAMIQFGSAEMNNFHQFRHSQKKVDKLRSLFMANLGYIEQGAQQLIAAATPAFPPAAAIGTALTYMLSACRQVSADYDVVTAFFEDMNAFLQRITILESRLPKYPAYRNCLMDVFSSVLEMCGFATKYIELGRFKKWVLSMVGGQDGDLGGARKKMDTSLSRLQSATEFAILGNTEELQRMNTDLQQNQDMQTQMMEEQTKMLETVMQSQDSVRSDLKNIQKLLVMFEERRRDDPGKQRTNKTASQNKPPTSNRVRSFFGESTSPTHEYRKIKENFIPETCTWIFDEPLWNSWIAQEQGKNSPRILAISGPPGSGKSHLAVSAYDQLVKLAGHDPGNNTCVAHFYFRETINNLAEFHYAIFWVVIQIAEQNDLLCEKICAEIQREDIDYDSWGWFDVWNKMVKPMFSGPTKARLQILWDGLDELLYEQKEELLKFLSVLKDDTESNITFLCTTRPILAEQLKNAGAESIEVTKEKQLPDLKALIWGHLNNDSGLRKFNKYMKQRISSTLEEKADGRMLYAEHMLRQFNIFGRELLVLKALEQHMPNTLEELFQSMLADLQHHTSTDELEAMRCLLAWLSFSYRPLTLDDSLALIKITSGGSFDLERELQGRQLAKFLRIADFEERVNDTSATQSKLDLQSPNNPDAPYNDGDLPLRFQERSMRGFFRNAQRGEAGLRTSSFEAHRQIFVICSKIICGTVGNVHDGLRKYAASAWAWHLSWTHMAQDSEEDRVAGLEALGAIMTNENNAAVIIESLGVDWDTITGDFKDGLFLKNKTLFAKMAVSLGEKVNARTLSWAKAVVEDPLAALVPLAKGHIANWFTANGLEEALRSYRFARTIAKLTKLSHLIKQEEGGDDSSDDEKDESSHYPKDEITGLFEAYEDIPRNANAYWAVAMLLEHSNHHKAALPYAHRAFDESAVGVERMRIVHLLADINLEKKDREAANKVICDGLSSNRQLLPPKLLRTGLVKRAKTEVALGKLDDAIRSYEEARLADPEEPMPGDILKDEFKVYIDKHADAELMALVRKWKPMERLAWMTWKYDSVGEEDHESLRRAAGRAGEQELLVQVYDEVIKLLDSVDSAAPIRYQLAIAHWGVRGDIETAKALMNETLDGNVPREYFAFTHEDPVYTLICAVLLQTEMIYEQFRGTSDRDLKAKLFTEIQGLMKRNLAQSISTPKSGLTHHTLTVARMARKMASAHDFQDTLQAAFDICYDALIDAVGWNDIYNLCMLATVLSNLEGMERAAETLFTAQFSRLDPAVLDGETDNEEDDDDDDDSDSDGSEESRPTDEGDLSDTWCTCDGECDPVTRWDAWKGRPIYMCLICANVNLCEGCYSKRQAYNTETGGEAKCQKVVGSLYCGPNHRYIKGPVEGWKGIKDGVMTIESADGKVEKVKFRDWLDELKTVKWKQAWEGFWRKED